ncbi:hypothetical protein ACAW74_05045 [Fibrella sp. WM1]|uniref:hypothetical protein n=1 Tax=Fibrella musci TaxID=3242485 RepID=UPI003520E726
MPIPAPEGFTDLRVHLHEAGVDAAHLSFVLERYLETPDNMPRSDWSTDVQAEHQAWAYREAVGTFQQMIVDKPDDGNGDDDEA